MTVAYLTHFDDQMLHSRRHEVGALFHAALNHHPRNTS